MPSALDGISEAEHLISHTSSSPAQIDFKFRRRKVILFFLAYVLVDLITQPWIVSIKCLASFHKQSSKPFQIDRSAKRLESYSIASPVCAG